MNNQTNIKISKKYEHMISSVEKDDDGYWAYSEDGFMFDAMDSHTAHEDTQADLLRVISSLKPCNCEECRRALEAKNKNKI